MTSKERFNSYYGNRNSVCSNAGDRIAPTYTVVYDDDGIAEVEQTGKTDVYAAIQSHRESVDLGIMLDRYALGDPDALNKVQGLCADYTALGITNIADVLNLNVRGQQIFDSMPVAEKEKYGNDYFRFLNSYIGDVAVSDNSGDVSDEAVEVEEVSTDE